MFRESASENREHSFNAMMLNSKIPVSRFKASTFLPVLVSVLEVLIFEPRRSMERRSKKAVVGKSICNGVGKHEDTYCH